MYRSSSKSNISQELKEGLRFTGAKGEAPGGVKHLMAKVLDDASWNWHFAYSFSGEMGTNKNWSFCIPFANL